MYDLKSEWYDWIVNNKPLNNKTFRQILDEDGFIYSVKILPSLLPRDVQDLRQESENYLDTIINSCGYKKYAVLVSGIDSEIIARYLKKKNLDVKIYHVKYWFKNDEESDIIKQIANELKIPYSILNFNWKTDKQSLIDTLSEQLTPATIKHTFTYALNIIEDDRYIFSGIRNLEKHATATLHSINKKNINTQKEKIVYIDTRQLSNRYALNNMKRKGCSVFWFNDARSASSMLRDKRTIFKDNGEIENDDIFSDLWKNECLFNKKTNPFEGDNSLYKWENWHSDFLRDGIYKYGRAKSNSMMQKRYLRMKYGEVYSVVDDTIERQNASSRWIFGGSIDLNKIL
tara:strand:- start:393 stop:1424 length:1032 start_codon:yes stop_codon:yes gene_type:complete